MCARDAQQQAAEQDIRQAEEIGRMRLIRHGLNSNYFSLSCKGFATSARFLPRLKFISA